MVGAYRPANLAEALEIRTRLGAIPFAGGTDLMVKFRRGAGALPGFDKPLLLLDRCEELRGIARAGQTLEAGALEAGAMVTLAALAEHPFSHEVLREIISLMGGPAIRNVATLGGNVCNASPAGDTLPFLYAFDASVRLASLSAERVIPICDFITGPGTTILRPDEILLAVVIPSWQPGISLYRKVGTRRANALTKVSIAAFADMVNGRVARARIALGAVAPTVVRLRSVERMLEGEDLGNLKTGLLREKIREAAAEKVRPIDDQRSTAAYRRRVAIDLVDSFVERLEGRCRSPEMMQAAPSATAHSTVPSAGVSPHD